MCTEAGQHARPTGPPNGAQRVKVIACEVLHRELCRLSSRSAHTVDVEFMPKGLHDLPSNEMRARLQARIDASDKGRYRHIALAYGLCSNGLAGLRASRTRLIVPRAHDCITLFLGGRERYRRFFEANPGSYVLTSGWIERGECDDDLQAVSIQSKAGLLGRYEDWVEAYGRDNAEYLWETLRRGAEASYNRYVFIEMGVEPDARFEREARRRAREKNWTFGKIQGDMGLLRRLVEGPWVEDEFLDVPPGWRIEAEVQGRIMRAAPDRGRREKEVEACGI